MVIPFPRTLTNVFAVPKSMPMSSEKKPSSQSKGLNANLGSSAIISQLQQSGRLLPGLISLVHPKHRKDYTIDRRPRIGLCRFAQAKVWLSVLSYQAMFYQIRAGVE